MKVRLLVLIAVLAFAPHLLLSQDFTVGANCSVHVTKALPDTINDFFNTADIVGYIEEYAKEGRVRIEGKRIEVGIAYKESLMLTLRFLNYDPSEYRNKSEFNYVRVEPSDWLELILARWLSASIMSISDTTIKSKMLQDSALFVFPTVA